MPALARVRSCEPRPRAGHPHQLARANFDEQLAELAEDPGGRAPDAVAGDGIRTEPKWEVADRGLDELDLGTGKECRERGANDRRDLVGRGDQLGSARRDREDWRHPI